MTENESNPIHNDSIESDVKYKKSIHLTTRHIAGSILVLQTLLIASVSLSWLGYDSGVIRPVLSFIYLTFVPGFLVLRLAGVVFDDFAEWVVYATGVSLTTLMFIGVFVNFVFLPITPRPLTFTVPALSAIGLVLLALYFHRVEEDMTIHIPVREMLSPIMLGLTLLPFIGVYGALVLTRFSNNTLLLTLYALIAIVPLLALGGLIPRRFFPYALWAVSASLLLQNALTGQFLAWGDQVKEATLVMNVLRTGVWLPENGIAFGNKFSMLRIVILHPIYVLFTDLQIVWIFKVIHPLLFSVTPVALYLAYRNYVSDQGAFLSAYLFMSLFSFFIVLSRSTRTATALFFLALIVLLISGTSLEEHHMKLLAILFVSSIVVSHYGISYMVFIAIVIAYPLVRLLRHVGSNQAQRRSFTSLPFVSLYTVCLFAWYIYASPRAKTFHLLIGFADHFMNELYTTFITSPETTSASIRYATSNFSSTVIDVLRFYNIAIGIVIVIGLTLTISRLYQEQSKSETEHIAYAVVFLAVFGLTFLPVERFNTARTFPTTLMFFAPFFVVGVRELGRQSSQWIPVEFSRVQLHHVAAIFIAGYFLLNVGFVSATVVHEYSPNALVEKDRIMDDGHPREKEYFYKQYPTVYGITSNDWLRSKSVAHSTVYSSNWPGNPRGAVGYHALEASEGNHVQLQVQPIPVNRTLGPGYVYLGTYSHPAYGNIVSLPADHFGFEWIHTSRVNKQWSEKDKIYTNGGSTIYH